MTSKAALLLAALAVAFTPAVTAQARPDFTGTWKPAESFNRTTITVEGNRMTVTLTLAGNSDSTVYLLDGTPSIKTIRGPGGQPLEQVYTSSWEGHVLVTTIATKGPPMIERRWIEPDGTMNVERTFTLPGDRKESVSEAFRRVK